MDLPFSLRLLFSVLFLLECSHVEAASFDYFTLAFQWPITYCSDKKSNCYQKHIWTIHGLWPSNKNRRNPDYCNNTFDGSQITTIEKSLDEFWPNLDLTKKNIDFWSYEWRKHGSCAYSVAEVNTILKYFKKVLQLAEQYNVTGILSKEKITENNFNTYTINKVQSAMKLKTGHKSYITWIKNRCTPLLSEIRICFSKTFDVIDCPLPVQPIEIKVKYPAACTKNLKSSKEGEYPTTNTQNFKESPSSCGHCIKPKPPDNTTAVEVEVTSLSVFLLIAFGFVLYVFVKKCKRSSYEQISDTMRSDENQLHPL